MFSTQKTSLKLLVEIKISWIRLQQRMKFGVFATIPQLNAKILNGSHQHHQKTKKFVFKSQKWRQCLCVSTTHHEFVPEGQTVTGSFYLSVLECLWKRIHHVWPEYSAPGSWFLLHDNAPVHWAVAVQEFLAQNECVCSIIHPTPLIYPPMIIFCSPNWSYHWKSTCLKMFKTSKQLWHRVFGPYHKKTCRGPSSLC